MVRFLGRMKTQMVDYKNLAELALIIGELRVIINSSGQNMFSKQALYDMRVALNKLQKMFVEQLAPLSSNETKASPVSSGLPKNTALVNGAVVVAESKADPKADPKIDIPIDAKPNIGVVDGAFVVGQENSSDESSERVKIKTSKKTKK